ncbi:MAG: hypothetical protein IJ387_03080 [Thermoguttaceae bacterium]|nr:hypothetical protein [Thermoguttaceae bacterium]
MKRSISLWTVCALVGFAALGCQEKPEIAFEEYGETRATLPDVDGVPEIFEIPEEVEPRTCAMREQALNSARSDRKREAEFAQETARGANSQTK